jgi:hypothetical protein
LLLCSYTFSMCMVNQDQFRIGIISTWFHLGSFYWCTKWTVTTYVLFVGNTCGSLAVGSLIWFGMVQLSAL